MIARALFWLLMTLVLLAPLPFGSNRPWAWSLLAFSAAVLLGLWALATLANPELHAIPWRRYKAILLAFVIFILWTAFQAAPFSPMAWHHPSWQTASQALGMPLVGAISVSPDDSLNGVMRLASYAAVFWLAMQLGHRSARAHAAWWVLTLGIAIYAVYGILVQIGGSNTILWFPKWAYHGLATSTFVNRNHFAAYAGLGLILTVALIAEEVKAAAQHGLHTRTGLIYFLDHMRPRLFLLMSLFVLLAVALLLSGSRAGLFCSVIGIFAMLAAFALNESLRSRSLIIFAGIIFLVLVGILIVGGGALTARMGELIENSTPRGQVYALALRAIAERPLLGSGLGSFEHIFRELRGEGFGPNELTFNVAHNSYLELGVEAGLPAAMLLYAALFIILLVLLRGARTRRRDTIYPCSGIGAMALLGTHSLVDFSLQIPAIAVTFSLIAGIAYAQSWRRGRPQQAENGESFVKSENMPG